MVCDCGTPRVVENNRLLNGGSVSCGCFRKERALAARIKHGATQSREYSSWQHAKDRCCNPNNGSFHNYGGRGITFSAVWMDDFASFYEHVGPCPDGCSLDRIDVNGNYEPGNVRWATRIQQARNTRRSLEATQ